MHTRSRVGLLATVLAGLTLIAGPADATLPGPGVSGTILAQETIYGKDDRAPAGITTTVNRRPQSQRTPLSGCDFR